MRRFVFGAFAGILASVSVAFTADPIEFGVGSFTFSRPEGWQWIIPSSSMRKAQLSIPGGSEGDPGEVTFFHFGQGQGGGVQANVDRWFGQFQNSKTHQSVETIGSTKVTFVDASGTFLSGMPGTPPTPKADYALRGAILESPSGDVFVKLTGPASLVSGAEKAFRSMIAGAASR